MAVGTNAEVTEGVVVPLAANGTPGIPQEVTGTSDLDGLACPSATSCIAVGTNDARVGVVVAVTSGTPGSAKTIAGTTELSAVACPSATSCLAVGDLFEFNDEEGASPASNAGVGVVVPISGGAPGSAQTVAGTSRLPGVACPSSTNCVAVGSNAAVSAGVVVPVAPGGAPGAPQAVTGHLQLFGVACPNSSGCVAAGSFISEQGPGVLVPIAPDGTVGTVQSVSGLLSVNAVGCSNTTSCLAVEPYQPSVLPLTVTPGVGGGGGGGTTTTTTASFGNQLITLTIPSACVAAGGKLPVTLNSTSVAHKKPKLKFKLAQFFIDKGRKHTMRVKKTHKVNGKAVAVEKHGKPVFVKKTVYLPNATAHHVLVTESLSTVGLTPGTHTLRVKISFKKKTRIVTKTLKVTFAVC